MRLHAGCAFHEWSKGRTEPIDRFDCAISDERAKELVTLKLLGLMSEATARILRALLTLPAGHQRHWLRPGYEHQAAQAKEQPAESHRRKGRRWEAAGDRLAIAPAAHLR